LRNLDDAVSKNKFAFVLRMSHCEFKK